MTANSFVELADQFASTPRELLLDVGWLEEALRPHCKLKYLGWRGTRLRIIQHPREFSQWLVLMANYGVKSYLEVGTSTGGSFFTTDAYLRAAVPGFEMSVGYDRTAKMGQLEEYKARFPATEFRNQGSRSMDVAKEHFDAAFVDARHVEKWVIHDFGKVSASNPILIGFHDILRDSVRDAWAKLRVGRSNLDFKVTDVPLIAQCGIGVLARDGDKWSSE